MPESRWSSPELVPVATGDSHQPALAAIGDVVHLVWASDKSLFHSRRIDGIWQTPVRIISGEQPVLAQGLDGTLHCIYANWFLGNCEIFYIRFNGEKWGFPQWVSRTSGVSTQPALDLDEAGAGHIVWSDDTPGRPVIYYAGRGQIAWLHAPIPNATGTNPSIAVTPAGHIYVAWQDRTSSIEGAKVLPGPYQIFCSSLVDHAWSIPELVSEDRSANAITPRLVAGPNDDVHLVWQQENRGRYHIRYAAHLAGRWSPSISLSQSEEDARLPLISVNAGGRHVVWVEGATIKLRTQTEAGAPWADPEIVCPDCPGLSELAAAFAPSDTWHLAWSANSTPDARQINYLRADPPKVEKNFLPIIQATA